MFNYVSSHNGKSHSHYLITLENDHNLLLSKIRIKTLCMYIWYTSPTQRRGNKQELNIVISIEDD